MATTPYILIHKVTKKAFCISVDKPMPHAGIVFFYTLEEAERFRSQGNREDYYNIVKVEVKELEVIG